MLFCYQQYLAVLWISWKLLSLFTSTVVRNFSLQKDEWANQNSANLRLWIWKTARKPSNVFPHFVLESDLLRTESLNTIILLLCNYLNSVWVQGQWKRGITLVARTHILHEECSIPVQSLATLHKADKCSYLKLDTVYNNDLDGPMAWF